MTKLYVLTGGPGTGKSSIILALEQLGEYVMREAAGDYIKLRQAHGQKTPWTEPDFQDRILDLQLQREARIPKDAKRAFLDRGIHDGLAYAQKGTQTYDRILTEAQKARYDTVFLIGMLDSTETTETRRECHEEAALLGQQLAHIYQEHGYEMIALKAGTLQERVARILKHAARYSY